MAPKIVISDHIFPSRDIELRLLAEGLSAELVFCMNASEENLMQVTQKADAVLVTFAHISERIISNMDKCRIIARYGVGVDNIHVASAAAKGIPVTNVPDYCVDEVSDHALALILALGRKIAYLDRQVREGDWDFRRCTPIFRFRGSTLGLIAYGRIAQALAAKSRALGMRVLTVDPYVKSLPASEATVVDFETLLAESDFISVHCPLTDETRNLVSTAQFKKMKPTAYIVNTARGGIIDEFALAEALASGTIAGAGLDVLAQEPIPTDHPLRREENCIITPYAAFHSEEATEELQRKAVGQVIKALTGQLLDYRVN